MTAEKDAEGGWMAAQNELAALSTNSVHQVLPNASHSMLTEDKDTAARSSRAINEVVNAVRTKTALTGQAGLKMNTKTLTTVIAAGIGVTIMLSACGSTNDGGHAARARHRRRPSRLPFHERRRFSRRRCCPNRPARSPVGVRTVPSVSPAATTRVWYPADSGTGTGTAGLLLGQDRSPRTGCRPSS